MTDKDYAQKLNTQYSEKAHIGIQHCQEVYNKVQEAL